MKEKYNLDQLNSLSTIDLVERLGIETVQRGTRTYMPCPNHEHNETQYDHCCVYESGCYCFSCGKSFDNFDIVKSFFDVDFATSTKIIAKAYGITPDAEETNSFFPLKKTELDLIGLKRKEIKTTITNIGFYGDFTKKAKLSSLGGFYFTTNKKVKSDLYDLYMCDKNSFCILVQKHINKTKKELEIIREKNKKEYFKSPKLLEIILEALDKKEKELSQIQVKIMKMK